MARSLATSATPLEELLDRLSEWQHAVRPASIVEVLSVRVYPQMLVQRSQHVLWRFGIRLGKRPLFVGGADHSAPLYPSASDCRAEDVGIMVSPGVVVYSRRAAELAPGDDQRAFQKAALLEIFQECRVRP